MSEASKFIMGGNSVEGEASSILDIDGEEDNDVGLVHKIKERLKQVPLLQPAVGENRCIFKLPESFKNKIDKSYEAPQMVSIGPYHLNIDQLQIKWHCLEYLLNNKKSGRGDLKGYIESIRPLEINAKECYSEKIDLNPDDFLEMMVLDGCFILEWLRFTYLSGGRRIEGVENHPLALIDAVLLLKIYRDLLLLENQIPFFVLEKLFETFKITLTGIASLSYMVAEVFSVILGIRVSKERHSSVNVKCQHLLDIVRSIFVPLNVFTYYDLHLFRPEFPNRTFDAIPSISKLRRAGINVHPRKKERFLRVEFHDGVIEMPKIILNDLMCTFLMNCVAFEQCHPNLPPDISVYVLFLSCLVKNAEDIEFLCENRVIDNYMETDAAKFINNLGKGIETDAASFINNMDESEFFVESKTAFFALCFRVNQYYQNRFRWQWTSFKAEYFDKPWTWISVFAGLVLFVLSFLQTYYTMYPKHPRPS